MKALYSVAAALALALFLVLPVAAEPPITLEGRVVNGTKGGGLVAGLEVTLRASSPQAGPDQRTTTDNEGKFRFAGLSAAAPVSYTVSASYAGVDYKSASVAIGSGEEQRQVELPVYDTTEDSAAILADIAHAVIEVDPGSQTLVVMEYQALSNGGDKTYVGPLFSGSQKREALRLPVPKGATHVQAIDGLATEDLVPLPGGEGFGDTAPFPPGKREVAYSYMLQYSDRDYTFQRPLAYPVGRINVLVSDGGFQVKAPGFSSQQTTDIGGKKYLLLSGPGLAQGQPLEIQLTGLPLGAGDPSSTADNLKLAAMGLLPAAVGVALVLFFVKHRRPQMRPVPVAVALDEEKALLIRSLAELDDGYEAGTISEPDYRRLRADKKRKLAELW